MGCNSCINQLVNHTKNIISKVDTNFVTFISANSNHFSHADFTRLYIDTFNYINEYAFGVTNVTLVFTSQHKVDSIVPLMWDDEIRISQLLRIE